MSTEVIVLIVRGIALPVARMRGRERKITLLRQPFFVNLHETAGYLYIKAVQEIKDFEGYGQETVLNSSFYYELHSKNSRHRGISRL